MSPFYLIPTQISVYKRTELHRGARQRRKINNSAWRGPKNVTGRPARLVRSIIPEPLRNNEFIFVPYAEMNLKNDVRPTGQPVSLSKRTGGSPADNHGRRCGATPRAANVLLPYRVRVISQRMTRETRLMSSTLIRAEGEIERHISYSPTPDTWISKKAALPRQNFVLTVRPLG